MLSEKGDLLILVVASGRWHRQKVDFPEEATNWALLLLYVDLRLTAIFWRPNLSNLMQGAKGEDGAGEQHRLRLSPILCFIHSNGHAG